MDALVLLIEERDRLHEAIATLAGSQLPRRGRPGGRWSSTQVKKKSEPGKRSRRGRPSRIIGSARRGRLLKGDIERVVAEKG